MSETSRLDWVPGQKGKDNPGNIQVTMREMGAPDVWIVSRILKAAGHPVSMKYLVRALSQFGWTARVAVRNQRNPVGVCISRHTPYRNQIERFWTHDVAYPGSKFPLSLLLLASWEKPEVPTYFTVDKTSKLNDRLRDWGWSLDGIDDDRNTWKAGPWYGGEKPVPAPADRAAGEVRREPDSAPPGPDV